jgi:hypothetical protein
MGFSTCPEACRACTAPFPGPTEGLSDSQARPSRTQSWPRGERQSHRGRGGGCQPGTKTEPGKQRKREIPSVATCGLKKNVAHHPTRPLSGAPSLSDKKTETFSLHKPHLSVGVVPWPVCSPEPEAPAQAKSWWESEAVVCQIWEQTFFFLDLNNCTASPALVLFSSQPQMTFGRLTMVWLPPLHPVGFSQNIFFNVWVAGF